MTTQLQNPAATVRDTADARWRERLSIGVQRATIANCVLVLAALVLICVVSEQWWFSAALCYLPRSPLLLPSVLLLPAALFTNRVFTAANALCVVIVVGPIMGLTVPLGGTAPARHEGALRIVSCNVQNGMSDLPGVLAELDVLNPDIVALQETEWGFEILEKHFADWHTIHAGEFWISSKYPLQLVDLCVPEAFERDSAVVCEVAAPTGTFAVCNVHLATPRHGVNGLRWHSPVSGAGVTDFEWHQWQRHLESAATREFLDHAVNRPVIALGDFNSPTSSSLFLPIWGDGFVSAFDAAGSGYGYTAPCNTRRLWPANTPWVRIDHILCDPAWSIHSCGIGTSAGSDHRLIWADVSLHAEPSPAISD